ncbi:hypothetical protein D3C71_445090 [compost metagenome]
MVVSCGAEVKKHETDSGKYAFAKDSLPNFELLAKQLKETSTETVIYELTVLNHTSETKKFLFYHCDIHFGIRVAGGVIVPQKFQCNANVPYYRVLPAHGKLIDHVTLYRQALRAPTFYFRLIEVDVLDLKDNFVVLDTLNLKSN